jgi:acetolactate synthase-1/2/3 large subunit
VIVDITKDVTAATCDYRPVQISEEEPAHKYTEDDIKAALKLIKAAKRPFIYVGGGAVISGASGELQKFAETIDAPVCDTLMGKGALDGNHRLYTGMIGMHGTKTSNFGVSECDLLITLGARFSDRVIGNARTFATKAKILQVDIDAAEINKNIRTNVAIIGDLKKVLEELNSQIEKADHSEWLEKIQDYKKRFPLSYETDKLTCPYIIEELDRLTDSDAIITTDVGQHQMWTSQYYKFKKPRTFLTSGGLGTMGYGLGACIGAKVGNPDKVCVNVAGDGCFRMNMNELATASRYKLPIIEIVINNHVLGMVRQWQTLFYQKHYSETVFEDNVDYCKVAEGLGCTAIRVTKKSEVVPALEKALSAEGPVLIDCLIEEDDKVFPMVSPGRPLSECFDASDLKG